MVRNILAVLVLICGLTQAGGARAADNEVVKLLAPIVSASQDVAQANRAAVSSKADDGGCYQECSDECVETTGCCGVCKTWGKKCTTICPSQVCETKTVCLETTGCCGVCARWGTETVCH